MQSMTQRREEVKPDLVTALQTAVYGAKAVLPKSASPSFFDEPLGRQMLAEGYSVSHHFATCFYVHRPAAKGGGHYRVDVREDTCNCVARTRCRHRRALGTLVFLVSDSLCEAGQYGEGLDLLGAWNDVCDEMRAERRAA